MSLFRTRTPLFDPLSFPIVPRPPVHFRNVIHSRRDPPKSLMPPPPVHFIHFLSVPPFNKDAKLEFVGTKFFELYYRKIGGARSKVESFWNFFFLSVRQVLLFFFKYGGHFEFLSLLEKKKGKFWNFFEIPLYKDRLYEKEF